MPPQSVAHARALGDEVVAVIEQQADLHCLLVQIRGREAVGPVLDDRAGDRERVDLVRLPRLTLPAPGGAHPLGCDAHDPFAGGQQRLLQPAGDLPAVLDRPHPLIIEPARPFDRGQVAPARPRQSDERHGPCPCPRRQPRAHACACACPSRSRSFASVPFVWLTTDEADLRRTNVTRGKMPRSYQATPKVLGRRRATRAKPARPDRSTVGLRVSPPPARGHITAGSDVTAPAPRTMTVTLDFARLLSEVASGR
jgi:hypothetical protein